MQSKFRCCSSWSLRVFVCISLGGTIISCAKSGNDSPQCMTPLHIIDHDSVVDVAHHLEWTRAVNGGNWEKAKSACRALGSNWVLPSAADYHSLFVTIGATELDSCVFSTSGYSNDYWTSAESLDPVPGNPGLVYYNAIAFIADNIGSAYETHSSGQVSYYSFLCVRPAADYLASTTHICDYYAEAVTRVVDSYGCAGSGQTAQQFAQTCHNYVDNYVTPASCYDKYGYYLDCASKANACNPCRAEYCALNDCMCQHYPADGKACLPTCY